MSDNLFPDLVPIEVEPEPEVDKSLSAQRRLTARQKADVERGRHPLTRGRLSPVEGATCGGCVHRIHELHHNRTYPKCDFGNGIRSSSSAHSDVRAWWPGCVDYEPKERSDSDG